MRVRLACLAVLGAIALTAGCGVSTEDAPREIEPPRGPFPAPVSMAPIPPAAGTAAEPLYFVRSDRLVAVLRRVHAAPTIQEQVGHLIAGPTEPERGTGLSSTLNGNTPIAQVGLAGTEARINLRDDADETGRSDQVLAFGQIVCTLTARPDVTAVTFHTDGRRLGIPRADGSLSTGPLTAADYAALIAPA